MVELILDGKSVPEDMIRKAVRAGTIEGKLTPILCGSAKNFHGVQLLLDAVVDYLPSPAERPPVQGIIPKSKEKETAERKPDPKEPFSCLAFKTISEPTGDLVFLRIYSDELHPMDDVLNTSINRSERVARIFCMRADRRDFLAVAAPGYLSPLPCLLPTRLP